MTKLHHRIRSKANASLISIAQRFSDILIIFLGLYIVCTVNNINFGIKHLLSCLLVLTIFQMIGGITDFYRSWRGVKLISELDLIIKNWTLSLILMVGILSYSKYLNFNFRISFEWYIVVSIGVIICRMIIRCCSTIYTSFRI